jgi:tRNA(Phe) wybutosine-synthesizing methylase Tyw3
MVPLQDMALKETDMPVNGFRSSAFEVFHAYSSIIEITIEAFRYLLSAETGKNLVDKKISKIVKKFSKIVKKIRKRTKGFKGYDNKMEDNLKADTPDPE